MISDMQKWTPNVASIIEHAKNLYPKQEVISRMISGEIHRVDHNGKISLILNDSLQWHKNLLVHSRRRSFLSNSNFELIRLQASYKYKMLSVE